MFELEKSLAAWRQAYNKHQAFSNEDLDELEQHVRDQVAALTDTGMSPADAFAQAMQEMGGQEKAIQEYEKVYLSYDSG